MQNMYVFEIEISFLPYLSPKYHRHPRQGKSQCMAHVEYIVITPRESWTLDISSLGGSASRIIIDGESHLWLMSFRPCNSAIAFELEISSPEIWLYPKYIYVRDIPFVVHITMQEPFQHLLIVEIVACWLKFLVPAQIPRWPWRWP